MGVKSALVTTSLRGSIFADKTPAAARQASGRVRTKLQDLGMIGVSGGYVWLPQERDMRDSDMSRSAPSSGAPAPTSEIPQAQKAPKEMPSLWQAAGVTCVTPA
jgi:hypothetical protein